MPEQPQFYPDRRVESVDLESEGQMDFRKKNERLSSVEVGRAVRLVHDAYPAETTEQPLSVEAQSVRYIGSVGVNLADTRQHEQDAA